MENNPLSIVNNPLLNDRLVRCETCNKIYSSYKSLWNHKKKLHNKDKKNNSEEKDKEIKELKNLITLLVQQIDSLNKINKFK